LSFATTVTLEPPHGLTFASLLLHGYLLWDIFYRQLTGCFPHANDGLVDEFDGMLVWCFSESFAWSWSMSTMIMSLGIVPYLGEVPRSPFPVHSSVLLDVLVQHLSLWLARWLQGRYVTFNQDRWLPGTSEGMPSLTGPSGVFGLACFVTSCMVL
jgi:hypothetical protein